MLLVDHHDPQPLDRRPHRAARPHHDPGAAVAHAVPLGDALGIGEPRMKHRHVIAKSSPEPPRELRGERDLRDQGEGAEAAGPRMRDRLQVHPRLSASGHSVQQERREGASVDGSRDLAESPGLGGRRIVPLPAPRSLDERRRTRRHPVELGELALLQRPQMGPRPGKSCHHLFDRNRPPASEQPRQHLRLPWSPRHRLRRRSRQRLGRRHQLRRDAGAHLLARQRHQPAPRQIGDPRARQLRPGCRLPYQAPQRRLLARKVELSPLEHLPPRLGQPRHQRVAHVHAGRQRRLERRAERSEVMPRRPPRQHHDLRRQQRRIVEEPDRLAHLGLGLTGPDDDPGSRPAPQRHQHAPAGLRLPQATTDAVGEQSIRGGDVQRNGVQLIRGNRLPLPGSRRAPPWPPALRSARRAAPTSRAR